MLDVRLVSADGAQAFEVVETESFEVAITLGWKRLDYVVKECSDSLASQRAQTRGDCGSKHSRACLQPIK